MPRELVWMDQPTFRGWGCSQCAGVGVGLDFLCINPVKALYWTAVINGLLAPFLLVAILVVASDRRLMQGQPSSRLGWAVVAITTVAMFAAGIAMFVV
jgi:Mn2+/Fe2+ NRAMP family transporter